MMHRRTASSWLGPVGALSAAAGIGLVAGAPRTAEAREYEAQVRVESLEDLYELQHNGDLEDETVEILAALLERPMRRPRPS